MVFQVSPMQRIHMKNQAFFSSKHKSKKLKCRLLQFLFGTLRVKPLFLNILGNLVKIKVFFIRIKVLIVFFSQIKVLKDFVQNTGF